ncbi:hypothetical protein CEXT_243301 [Caerostris extrusa]|uniref:Uncharacterized protein n=1 Tax=Caerostris extrusa TaxID=172846 RepID=A0AAV4XR13_CAEEX|nr:hypothetical protein CEXT_243301 [Caerostris extrusa]
MDISLEVPLNSQKLVPDCFNRTNSLELSFCRKRCLAQTQFVTYYIRCIKNFRENMSFSVLRGLYISEKYEGKDQLDIGKDSFSYGT